MRKAIKNYADLTAAATASDAVTYTVNKDAVIKDAAASYELKDDVDVALIDKGSGSKTTGKSKKAIYIAVAAVAVVAAIFIIRKK